MRIRTEVWGLSLMTALGLVPSACGRVESGADDDGENDGGGALNSGGRGGSLSRGGAWSDRGGTEPVGASSGSGTGGYGTECFAPEVDNESGIVTCRDGLSYRAFVGKGCFYEPPPPTGEGGQGASGNASGGAQTADGECDPEQCTERPRGYCSDGDGWGGSGAPPATCHYGCLTDADCGSTEICLCSSDPKIAGTCIDAECQTDADCGPATRCASESSCFQFLCSDDPGCAVAGRPFLVGAEWRVAEVTFRSDWCDDAALAPDLARLTLAERRRLAEHYSRAGQMEHASIAAFARFSLQLLSLGAPPELVSCCTRAMADETAHARTCFALASRYAGKSLGPSLLPIEGCIAPSSAAEVVLLVITEGCIGETVAALEAAEAAEHAADPAVRAALRGIAEDEQRHAELAWRFVSWAIEQRGAEVERAVTERLVELSRNSRAPGTTAATIDDRRLAAHGLLPTSYLASLRAEAMAKVVAPCAAAMLRARPSALVLTSDIGVA